MKETQIALNLLTEITDSKVVKSKEYEDAINALCALQESVKKRK